MKLGSTGKIPEGKLHPGDKGELVFGVAHDTNGLVHVNFGEDVSWFAMPPEQAIEFAKQLMKHAGVKKVTLEI